VRPLQENLDHRCITEVRLQNISGADSVGRRSSRSQKSLKERLRRVARVWSEDDFDDGDETGAVEERGNDLERREDGQLDGGATARSTSRLRYDLSTLLSCLCEVVCSQRT